MSASDYEKVLRLMSTKVQCRLLAAYLGCLTSVNIPIFLIENLVNNVIINGLLSHRFVHKVVSLQSELLG